MRMELEELMTNRVLLEKMSDTDIHTPLRKPPKHVVIQEHHANPKEIRIEYKDSCNNITYTTDTALSPPPSPLPPPLILEGHGCKCPDKLKKVMKILWVVFIILYIFGMPIILIHMHAKLVETEQRLGKLEKKWNDHISFSGKTNEGGAVEALHQLLESSKNKMDDGKEKILPSDGMSDYMEKSYQGIIKSLRYMEYVVEEHKGRMEFFEKFHKWLNGTNLNGTDSKGNKCICLAQFLESNKEGIRNIPLNKKRKCKCKTNLVGNPGPQGPQGPKGAPGKDAVIDKELLESMAGPTGKTGERGAPGLRGPQGLPGEDGTCEEECQNTLQVSITYTRWGKSSCPKNSSTVYKGYMGGSYHTHEGGGSNYLCLPVKPTYKNKDALHNDDNRAYIYGVEYELGDSNIFDTSGKSGTYFDAVCSVCKVEQKSSVIMIPATTDCPDGWRREYHGYIMAQKRYLKRTEYICVDHKPDLDITTKDWGKGGLLHFVETGCGVLPCRTSKGNHYQQYLELSCAVCSS